MEYVLWVFHPKNEPDTWEIIFVQCGFSFVYYVELFKRDSTAMETRGMVQP